MYIEPKTTVKILKNVPLDNTYEHTLYFNTLSEQTNAFSAKTKFTLNNLSYQRVNKGIIRVEIQSEKLYDCNYLMFQNTAFGDKWFYAFIKKVEYVNNVTSEIFYEIDELQTWFFDFELQTCFVDREHSATDKLFENIQPEPVSINEYVSNTENILTDLTTRGIIIMIVDVDTESTDLGTLVDGTFSGCEIWGGGFTDSNKDSMIQSIRELLDKYKSKPDSVVAMYMLPYACIGDPNIITQLGKFEGKLKGKTISGSFTNIGGHEQLDGYMPKNNKMYTYPFNFLMVHNNNGDSLNLRYEFFKKNDPKWKIFTTAGYPVQIKLIPDNYKNKNSLDYKMESLTISDFPMCSWGTDSYRAWVAQNGIAINRKVGRDFATNAVSSVASAAPIAAINPVLGAAYAGVSTLANTLPSIIDAMQAHYIASLQPDVLHGNASSNVNFSNNMQTFFAHRMSIDFDTAKSIDNFLTKFGYSTRELKKPNTHSRPHWNYVKTIGCLITGSIPADSANMICKIHDNGITYWKKMSEVGDYSLNNSPYNK